MSGVNDTAHRHPDALVHRGADHDNHRWVGHVHRHRVHCQFDMHSAELTGTAGKHYVDAQRCGELRRIDD